MKERYRDPELRKAILNPNTNPYVQLVKKVRADELSNLFKKPKKDTGLSSPHYNFAYSPNVSHQADLLFLPDDRGYRYALVVTDIANRLSDAEPLKTKNSDEVAEAFYKIYQRGILELPKAIKMDDGSEFKGEVKKWFKRNGVHVSYAKPGRHRQLAMVERTNLFIGRALLKRMLAQELLTGQPSTKWVKILPWVINTINAFRYRKPPPVQYNPQCQGASCDLIPIGTKVRAVLDNPVDYLSGKRLHGSFRASDIRWNPEIRTIKNILLLPGTPPLYLLNDVNDPKKIDNRVAYTKNQLQIVRENEEAPDVRLIVGKPSTYVVKNIIGKKKIRGKTYYLVEWKGYPREEATWEPRERLIEDIPELVHRFETLR
jgi:hypothetical protein